MYYGNGSAASGGYNETTNPFAPTLSALPTYAQYVPSSYSPYNHVNNGSGGGYPQHHQQQQQQHNLQSPQSVVYVNNNEYWEDDYNMNKEDTAQDQQQQLVNYAPSLPSPQWTYEEENDEQPVDESKLRRITKTWCSKTTTPCILLGMVIAISFIIAYVYLVEAFVNRGRIARNANVTNVSLEKAYGDTYSGLRSVGRSGHAEVGVLVENTVSQSHVPPSAAAAAQLLPDMEPRYYVLDQILRPLDVGEVPPATPSSVLEDGEEEEEEDSSMVIPALVKAKHEPV
jgi:hypothetical protein